MRRQILSDEDVELRVLGHLADFGCAGADLRSVVGSFERSADDTLPSAISDGLERLVRSADAERVNGVAYRITPQGSKRSNGGRS